ncbi:MAG: hypothetical protein ACREDR_24750, partial [Blastocatellia bacterium]
FQTCKSFRNFERELSRGFGLQSPFRKAEIRKGSGDKSLFQTCKSFRNFERDLSSGPTPAKPIREVLRIR